MIALLQIWYAANLLGVFADNTPMAFLIVGLAVLALLYRGRFRRHWAAIYPAMLPFALWWLLAPPGERFAGVSLWVFHIPAWYLLYLATLQLLWQGKGGELRFVRWNTAAVVALAGLHAGDSWWTWASPYLLLHWLALRQELTDQGAARILPTLSRFRTYVSVLLLVCITGLGTWVIHELRGPLQSYMWSRTSSRWNPDAKRVKGFDAVTWIGSYSSEWEGGRDAEVAVRLFLNAPSEAAGPAPVEAPPYLRAATYSRYIGGFWRRVDTLFPLRPSGNIVEYSRFFSPGAEPETAPPQSPWASVHPALDMQGFLLLPPGLVGVALKGDSLLASGGTVTTGRGPKAENWLLLPTRPLQDTLPIADELTVPVALQPLLDSLLKVVATEYGLPVPVAALGAPPSSHAVQLAEMLPIWFARHFAYSLELGKPAKKALHLANTPPPDPMRLFVERRSGYCEHYATLGTLLLRRAGIPARYAKGFAAPEQVGDDAWVYRRAGAHAWVEVRLPNKGWQLLEMTPPGYRPSPAPPSWMKSLGESLRARMARAGLWFDNGGWRAVATAFEDGARGLAGRPSALALPAGAALLLVLGLLWQRRRRAARGPTQTAHARAWAARLAAAESILRRQGHAREEWETIGEFLARLPGDGDPHALAELRAYQSSRFRS